MKLQPFLESLLFAFFPEWQVGKSCFLNKEVGRRSNIPVRYSRVLEMKIEMGRPYTQDAYINRLQYRVKLAFCELFCQYFFSILLLLLIAVTIFFIVFYNLNSFRKEVVLADHLIGIYGSSYLPSVQPNRWLCCQRRVHGDHRKQWCPLARLSRYKRYQMPLLTESHRNY